MKTQKTEPIAVRETREEVLKSLDGCKEQFLQIADSAAKRFEAKKADFVSSVASDIGQTVSWAEAVIRQEREIAVLLDSVRTIRVMATYNDVFNRLKECLDALEEQLEMSICHSSSMMSNAVELAKREGTVDAIQTLRGWVRFMQRRSELFNAMRD